jgi:conjugal transfer mating pair stabilization protein TraG
MSSASFGALETAECLARSEAIRQTNTTYRVLAAVAESAMPKLRGAIEMIQYAVFPLIIAVAVAAGFGGLTILKAYVLSLIWVQLWPPLYAVVNFIMNSSAQSFGAQFQGLAESAAASVGIITAMVDHQAIAGMLTIAIPPIAAALVKGGEVGLQAVAGMMTAPHAAAKAASEIGALGNLKAGGMDLRPAYDYGAPIQRHWQADGAALVTNAGGTQRLVGGTSVDQGLPFSISSAGKESTAFTKASETMIRAAQTETDRAIESRAAAFESLFERARQQATGTRAGDMQFSQAERRFMEASREVQSVVDTYADKHQLTQSQRAALAAYAEAKLAVSAGPAGKIMKFLGVDFEVGAGARIEGMSAEEQARVREHAQQLAKETSFQKAIENLRAAGHRAESGSFSESGRRQVDALRASESLMQTAEHAAAASLERAQALRELAQRASSGERIIQQDFTTLALDRLEREGATIDGHTYNPGELTRAEALAIYTQGNAAQRADLMRALDGATRKEIEQYVLTQAQNMPTAADIEARYQTSRPRIDIQSAAAGNRQEVETRMPAPGQVKPRHIEVPGDSARPSPQQAGQMEVFRQRMEHAAEDPKKWIDLAGGAIKTAWNAGPSPLKAWKGEPDTPAIGRSEFPGGFDHGVKHQASAQPAPVQTQPQASPGFGLPEGKAGGDNPLTATPGGSNLGKVLGSSQQPVVIQQAPEQAEQEGKKDDLPPPRR